MNEKFQPGDMVKATQGAGKFFKSGDVGRVIRHHDDGTVKVDWSAGNNPQGHYGDGEWWVNESELVRWAELSTAKLTLPIVVGKKYVRRDGNTVVAQPPPEGYEARCRLVSIDGEFAGYKTLVYAETGRIQLGNYADEFPADLVSDYIEPAKGHPHAALMMEFAKDAAETDEPWRLWQFFFEDEDEWTDLDECPYWEPEVQFRRKPTITPDPHAENAAKYAKDMAETDKAWERWEYKFRNEDWISISHHPAWDKNTQYRRKEQA